MQKPHTQARGQRHVKKGAPDNIQQKDRAAHHVGVVACKERDAGLQDQEKARETRPGGFEFKSFECAPRAARLVPNELHRRVKGVVALLLLLLQRESRGRRRWLLSLLLLLLLLLQLRLKLRLQRNHCAAAVGG